MTTQIAQIVGNNIAYPPQRRTKQQQFGTVLSFNVDVMRHDTELLGEVMALQEKYNTLASEVSQSERAQLEAELDFYIEGSQRADEVFKKKDAEYFAEMKNHQKAKDDSASANERHRQLLTESEDEDVLLTRAQKAESEQRLQQSSESVYNAAVAESQATTTLNNLISERNDASRAVVAWKSVALEVQAELNG